MEMMMANDDITVQILREIRDGIDKSNKRLDEHILATKLGFDRVDRKFEDMGRRIVESEIRTATAITGLASTMNDVRDLLRDRLDLRDRVERCEHDIAELKNQRG
jgi:hypothetical protein